MFPFSIYTTLVSANRFTAHGQESRCRVLLYKMRFTLFTNEDELIDLLQFVGVIFHLEKRKWRGFNKCTTLLIEVCLEASSGRHTIGLYTRKTGTVLPRHDM
jgi:hypothetical protein